MTAPKPATIPRWYPVFDERGPWVAFLACRDTACLQREHVRAAKARYRRAMRADSAVAAGLVLHEAQCDWQHDGGCDADAHARHYAGLPWFAEMFRRFGGAR